MVTKINRPAGLWTEYKHDDVGNIIGANYSDGTWDNFAYNKNGALIEAANEHTTVVFERNNSGQVIKETQTHKDKDGKEGEKGENGEEVSYSVESQYNELYNRTQVTTSLGAVINTTRNQMGQAATTTANFGSAASWTAQMQYNGLGQEITRLLSGDILSEWQYNKAGKPTDHNVKATTRNTDTRTRKYAWGINNQLKSMTNNLTGGRITYGYDEFSNLVSAKHDGFSERIADIFRTADDVGNIYETQGKTDRTYTQGSRMTQANQHKQEYLDFSRNKINDRTDFAYDDEGNLVRKTTQDDRVWEYQYYSNGMLAKVTHTAPRKETTETRFKYDSLGRRVEKSTTIISTATINTPNTETPAMTSPSPAKTITFVWDGNNPIHEIETTATSNQTTTATNHEPNITTWVFNDDFVPAAKITKDDSYSIITDYLGTPVEAYDSEGDKVWSAELDIYGRVMTDRNHTPRGEVDFIPFRYQGQYHDTETGLYYNRFRYYDPTTGSYTQQDPIGLVGGNPTLYAYVNNPHSWIDPFGLDDLYALLAQKDGWYDVFDWGKKKSVGQMYLKKGELWKIGTSKDATKRYGAAWLRNNHLDVVILHTGINDKTAKHLERQKIKGYESSKGHLPPGNKCRH